MITTASRTGLRASLTSCESQFIDLPDTIQSGEIFDGVLHRLLVGFATFMTARRPLADGGREVPAYTSSIEAAAQLLETRLGRAEWALIREAESDLVTLRGPDGLAISLRAGRGQGALALSLAVLASARSARSELEILDMIEEIAEIVSEPDRCRQLQRI